MKKTTIANEIVDMISKGYTKAEIFAELIHLFGIKYQNLISQIMHFEYDYLREKNDPERAIRRDISTLMNDYGTKGEIYEQLYKKYGHTKNTLITTVLEKDYDILKQGILEGEKHYHLNGGMDYTIFFNLNEKLKVTNREKYNYKMIKEFRYNDKTLVGEVEIKRGKLFIGAYSYYENQFLTVFNFITVLNAFFKDYFILALSNMLSIEIKKMSEEKELPEFGSTLKNRKILLNCTKCYQQETDIYDQYLLDVFYTIDTEMLSMTIIGEKNESTD